MSVVLYEVDRGACGLPEAPQRKENHRLLAYCSECDSWYEYAGQWIKLRYDPTETSEWKHSEPYAGDEK